MRVYIVEAEAAANENAFHDEKGMSKGKHLSWYEQVKLEDLTYHYGWDNVMNKQLMDNKLN